MNQRKRKKYMKQGMMLFLEQYRCKTIDIHIDGSITVKDLPSQQHVKKDE